MAALIFLLVLASAAFWLWMLIECLTREPSGIEKLIWTVVILGTYVLGAVLYFTLRRPARLEESA